MSISEYDRSVARSSTTSDVFNAIAEAHRREILDAPIAGEKAVGAIVNDLWMSQPQVSKQLRVLSDVGLVRCRAEGVAGCTAWNPRASGRCTTGWPGTSRHGTTDWTGWMTTSKSYNNKESGSDT
jgi:Helix-turn-helix domain